MKPFSACRIRNIREAIELARKESKMAMYRLNQENLTRLQNAVRQAQKDARRFILELRKQHSGAYHFAFCFPPLFDRP